MLCTLLTSWSQCPLSYDTAQPPELNLVARAMAPPAGSSRPVVKCDFCDVTFGSAANVGRHVQTSHRNESRLVGLSTQAARIVFGTFGAAGTDHPNLLEPVPAPVALLTGAQSPRFSIDERLERAAHMTAVELENDDALNQPPPLVGETNDGLDEIDDMRAENEVDEVAALYQPPALMDDTDDGLDDHLGADNSDAGTADSKEDASVSDESGWSATDSDGGVVEAAAYGAYEDVGTFLSIGISAMAVAEEEAPMVQHVFLSSTAARIRAYYEAMPEASMAVPIVNSVWASRPTRFNSPALRGALRFALSAGGSGLSERDQTLYLETLLLAESEATHGTAAVGPLSAAFPTPRSFLSSVRHETNRVLAVRRWQQVPISVGTHTCTYYFRDILKAGLDAMAAASSVSFGDPSSLAAVDLEAGDDDASRVRHGTIDSDLYLGEMRDVRRIHGADAKVMGAQLHADEALVSWSGACYMFPVRANYVNVLDHGGAWTTVGYIEHIPKAVEKTAAARLATSDARNDLFHRCIAISMRSFARASETGVSAPLGGHGIVRLVPRVLGLVVDQLEERNFYALMGNRCRFFCSPCMEDRRVSGALHGIRAVDRDVIATLDAQLTAAVVRATDPRPSQRRALGEEHSALAFAPPLGAIHGLGTGATNLYRVVSFDLLHVWKLGILRMLAQRLPAVLQALCRGRGGARYGSVASTLDAINLRGLHLGRNCQASPAPPGYVCISIAICARSAKCVL